MEDSNQNKYHHVGMLFGSVLFIRSDDDQAVKKAKRYLEKKLGNHDERDASCRFITPAGKDTRKTFAGGIVIGFCIALFACAVYAHIVIL